MRVLICCSPAFCSPQSLSLFATENVLHLDEPSENELAVFLKRWRHLSAAQLDALTQLANVIPNLTVLKMCCMHAASSPAGAAELPVRSVTGHLALHEECLSRTALRCLSMLTLSRHGLSEMALRHALALCYEEDEGGSSEQLSGPACTLPVWERKALPWDFVGVDIELRAIRHLTRAVVHGKMMVLQLVSPVLRQAVMASSFFQSAKEQLCQVLISLFSDDDLTGIPKYQQLAALPALQLQLAHITSTLPAEGPASLSNTLGSLPFLQIKVEAGLLEDLLLDCRSAYRLIRTAPMVGAGAFLERLALHGSVLASFLKILVKPFHACTLHQLAKERISQATVAASPGARKSDGNLGEDFPPTTFLAVERSFSNPLVMSTAILPTEETVRCCDVLSAFSASPCIALGLEDGHVVIWDAVFNERCARWRAHTSPIVALAFVVESTCDGAAGENTEGQHIQRSRMLLTCSAQGQVSGWNQALYDPMGSLGELLFTFDAFQGSSVALRTEPLATRESYLASLKWCTK